MLDRLLSYLYQAFDADAERELALRLRHASGLAWQVQDRTLTLKTIAGALIATIALEGRTIDQVADLAVAAGCTLVFESADLEARAADSLLEGSGNENISNGDHLYVYGSLLWALMDAFAQALELAERNGIVAGLRQAYMHTAEAEWLDVWGGYFGVARDTAEGDVAYLHRIVVEVLRPRNNAIAIEQTIKDLTGADVYLREPWKEIFILDQSALSDRHHFQDGNFFTWGVFQPLFMSFVSAQLKRRIVAIVERNRPAGVLPVHYAPGGGHVTVGPPQNVERGWNAKRAQGVDLRDAILSSSLTLSDYRPQFAAAVEDHIEGNVPIIRHVTLPHFQRFRDWDDSVWGDETWDRGFAEFEIETEEHP